MKLDKEKKIKEKIEETISILDKIETIEGNPFLYTRIKANLDSGVKSAHSGFKSILLSPRFALIIVLLIINILSVVFILSKNNPAAPTDESFIVSLTDDYFLSVDEDILYHLNEGK
jgi:hypothetical protein